MSYTDRAVMDLLKRGQIGAFVPMNAKIADITHANINKHTISLASMGLPANVVCMILSSSRVAGTGVLNVYPNEGTNPIRIGPESAVWGSPCGIINERLQYALSIAGDDFDVYCLGYWTQGQLVS